MEAKFRSSICVQHTKSTFSSFKTINQLEWNVYSKLKLKQLIKTCDWYSVSSTSSSIVESDWEQDSDWRSAAQRSRGRDYERERERESARVKWMYEWGIWGCVTWFIRFASDSLSSKWIEVIEQKKSFTRVFYYYFIPSLDVYYNI